MLLTKDLKKNINILNEQLPIEKSYDLIARDLKIFGVDAYLLFVDGFTKDLILLQMLQGLENMYVEYPEVTDIDEWTKQFIPNIEIEKATEIDPIITSVLSGQSLLLLDGFNSGLLLDTRTYPTRGPQEPDLEKVTRGSRDGLVETIVFNTALIRRRVRDPKLTFEMKNVGKRSRADVAIGYIDDLVDHDLLEEVSNKLDRLEIDSIVMCEKSLDELLIEKKWYNPFPQVRYTERPDVAAAHLFEGHILLVVDNSPSVMIIPTTFFHFTQHAEDYYVSPLIGNYIRIIRLLTILISFLLIPTWLLMDYYSEYLPQWLEFIGTREDPTIPVFIQFLMLELALDILKISSIHTPSTLSTSLGIIGGLILSQFAVDVGWFVPETILYMAVVGISSFATPSVEFSYALRMYRLLILILTGVFKLWGFIIGIVITATVLITTKTFGNRRYMWPLIPFNGAALRSILFRKPFVEIAKSKKYNRFE